MTISELIFNVVIFLCSIALSNHFAELIFSEINFIPFFGYQIKNTAVISFITAFAFVVVAFMSPILSGIADYIGNKKRFMKIFVYIGSISCLGLYWFELQTIYLGLFFYFLGKRCQNHNKEYIELDEIQYNNVKDLISPT